MSVTLFMAMSVNGKIAAPDGSEEFLSQQNWEIFTKLAKKFGNFIVGMKTYSAVKGWTGGNSFDSLDVAKVVVTRQHGEELGPGYTPASSPQDAVALLRKKGFKDILLAGGSMLNSEFASRGLIDEVIVNVEPTLLGRGIPLFADADFQLPLKLRSAKADSAGIVTFKYTVVRTT